MHILELACSFWGKRYWDFDWNCIESAEQFESTDKFMTLSLLVRDNDILLSLFRSHLIPYNNVIKTLKN